MARSKPSIESAKQLPLPGERQAPLTVIGEAVPGGNSVSPVAIMQEQLASRLAVDETRWAPRTAFWVSVGTAAAIWVAIAAVVRAAL